MKPEKNYYYHPSPPRKPKTLETDQDANFHKDKQKVQQNPSAGKSKPKSPTNRKKPLPPPMKAYKNEEENNGSKTRNMKTLEHHNQLQTININEDEIYRKVDNRRIESITMDNNINIINKKKKK